MGPFKAGALRGPPHLRDTQLRVRNAAWRRPEAHADAGVGGRGSDLCADVNRPAAGRGEPPRHALHGAHEVGSDDVGDAAGGGGGGPDAEEPRVRPRGRAAVACDAGRAGKGCVHAAARRPNFSPCILPIVERTWTRGGPAT